MLAWCRRFLRVSRLRNAVCMYSTNSVRTNCIPQRETRRGRLHQASTRLRKAQRETRRGRLQQASTSLRKDRRYRQSTVGNETSKKLRRTSIIKCMEQHRRQGLACYGVCVYSMGPLRYTKGSGNTYIANTCHPLILR